MSLFLLILTLMILNIYCYLISKNRIKPIYILIRWAEVLISADPMALLRSNGEKRFISILTSEELFEEYVQGEPEKWQSYLRMTYPNAIPMPLDPTGLRWEGGNMTVRRFKKKLYRLLALKVTFILLLYSPIVYPFIVRLFDASIISTAGIVGYELCLVSMIIILQFYNVYYLPSIFAFFRNV